MEHYGTIYEEEKAFLAMGFADFKFHFVYTYLFLL